MPAKSTAAGLPKWVLITTAALVLAGAGILWHAGSLPKEDTSPSTRVLSTNADYFDAAPARTCASSETANQLLEVFLSNVQREYRDSRPYAPTLAAETTSVIENAVFDGKDPVTGKIRCEGHVGFHWPTSVTNRLDPTGVGSGVLDLDITYTISPAADGGSFIYGIQSAEHAGQYVSLRDVVTHIYGIVENGIGPGPQTAIVTLNSASPETVDQSAAAASQNAISDQVSANTTSGGQP